MGRPLSVQPNEAFFHNMCHQRIVTERERVHVVFIVDVVGICTWGWQNLYGHLKHTGQARKTDHFARTFSARLFL